MIRFSLLILASFSFSGCRSLTEEEKILSLEILDRRFHLDLTAMSVDAGHQGRRLAPRDDKAIHQLAALVREANPDVLDLRRIEPDAAARLLLLLPRFGIAAQDNFEVAAQEQPLLLFRRDRFDADVGKSGKQFRGRGCKAQYLIEKASGKSLFVGQIARYEAESLPSEKYEVLQHMRDQRTPSDALLLLGHWRQDGEAPLLDAWMDAFESVYGEKTIDPRIAATTEPREDFIYCERAACSVLAAEVVRMGAPLDYAFESWPLLSHLRVFGEKANKSWRLAAQARPPELK